MDPLNSSLISSEAQAKLVFLDLLHVKESFLRQKAYQLWLLDGDRNSHFLHSMVKSLIAWNSIHTVKLQDGSFSSDPLTVRTHAADFFKALLNT
ncbi:hypothetical protein QJS04_geneDACA019788 [Acorus gramineus]|uniref:Uncharacterized protein n=1 Tax=Acorus gramineus TaxID=55184 RepID=A0AAV9A1S7_ACOGR|nr:hypothetical protein QJS04_geneDACA019788 [Acorus gramineus]